MPRTWTPAELATLKARALAAKAPEPTEPLDLDQLRRKVQAAVLGLTPKQDA